MSLFEIPICPADDPTGTPTATLTEADVSALKISVSLNDLGEVRITLPRNRWQSLGLDMRETYYGRVKIPHIDADSYIQGFWLVGAEMILVSTDERGGEDITIGGPGPAWILTKAVLNHEEWTDHTGVYVQDGTWYFSGKSHGDILSILLAEDAANPHPALDGMESAGWGANLDVDGNTWEQFGGIFSQPVGTNYLDVIRQVQRGGEFEWWVTPNLNLRAFAGTHGRDLSGNSYGAGVVRFVGSDVTPDENRNIISQLTRRKDKGSQYTHVLVLGNDRREEGRVIEGSPIHRWAADPDWSSGDYVREGFMAYETNSTDILIRAGLRMIERSKDRSGRLAQFEVMPGRDESNGLYLPGAPGTDRGNYWIGDTVTIKTGGAEGIDFFNRDLRIARIRLELDQAAKDDTLETRDRSWHTFIETGDDAAPTSSAASVINEDGSHTCRCPSPGDPGDPGEPPTAPTEDYRWSFTDLGGAPAGNVYEDTTGLYPWSQMSWDDGIGTSAWHDDFDAHITWGGSGANINGWLPIDDGETYLIEADMTQRTAGSAVFLKANWYNSTGGSVVRSDYIAGPGVAVGVGTHYSATLTPPAGANYLRLYVDAVAGGNGAMDNVVISHGGSGGTPAVPGDDPVGTVGGTGEGVYAENDHYIPVGSILEHRNIIEGGPYHEAADVTYDNTASGLTAEDVQAAIDELETLSGGGGGAPTTADYLVGTAQAGLSAEIVVGTSPGGELGGTWASPTVDATHSGSTHAAATAAAHPLNTGDPHSQYRLEADDHSHASSGAQGGTIAHSVLTGVTANQHHNEDHASRHLSGGADAVKLDDLAAPDDNTDLNASGSAHGLLRKLDGNAAHFLAGDGSWGTPAGSVTMYGRSALAFCPGFSPSLTFGTNQSVAIISGSNGGALAQQIVVPSPMILEGYAYVSGDSTGTRTAEARLYIDNGDSTVDFVSGSDAAYSYTATGVIIQRQAVSGAPLTLDPGMYWLVLRNTHASNAINVRRTSAPTITVPTYRIHAGIAALGSSQELDSGWTNGGSILGMWAEGRVVGRTTVLT